MIPLILKIKRAQHKEIANAQDLIVEELYTVFNDAVIHGGTAIWRCYKGNRFSEDIDVYIPRDIKRLDALFQKLEKRGFSIEKKKIGENSLFSNLKINRIFVRFEALFRNADGILKEYETSDGNLLTVYTLPPEELIREKASAYLKRLKIRDLYDIFFLLRHVTDKKAIKKELNMLINGFRMPVDEKDLRILLLEGLVPETKKMMEYIKTQA